MKKLYVVRWEVEAVVLADSERHALEVGEDAAYDILSEADHAPDSASPMTHLPSNWDLGALPFGDDGGKDIAIGEHIDAGAAPAYVERKAKFAAVAAKLAAAKEQP